MIQAVNAGFENGLFWFLTPDGDVIYRSIDELGYPYFYSQRDLSGFQGVVSSDLETINVLYPDVIASKEMFKVRVKTPQLVNYLKADAGLTVESDIDYLTRRLGADGVIQWTAPRVWVSVDIEVDKDDNVFLIGATKVVDGVRKAYKPFYSVESFIDWLENERITVIVAYNGDGYDFVYIGKKLTNPELQKIYGRVLKLDGAYLYSKLMHEQIRSLRYVCQVEEVGEKLDISIENMNARNMEEVKVYNERDCELLADLMLKFGLVEVYLGIAEETGLMPKIYKRDGTPRYITEIPTVENYIMKHRDKFGVYLMDFKGVGQKIKIDGGYVFSKGHGVYNNVAVVDYSSLYPTVVMHKDYNGANKVIFNFFKSVMTDFFTFKTNYRAKFKETKIKKFELLGDVFKIFANGSYGIFQNIYFRYHDPDIAAFITATARDQIRTVVLLLEDKFKVPVIYGDTDSCFFLAESKERAEAISNELNALIQPFEVKLEHFFVKLFMRGSDDKETKKRYAGIDDAGKVEIKGLEVIRSDWNQFVKDKQKGLIDLILKEPNEGLYDKVLYYILEGFDELKAGAVDPMMLVLSKGIKSDKVYKNKNLPHLRALDQLEDNGSIVRFVSYLKTTDDVLVVERFEGKDVKSLIDWKYYTINYLNAMLRLLDSIAVEGQETSKEIIKRLVPKEAKNGKRGRSKKVD